MSLKSFFKRNKDSSKVIGSVGYSHYSGYIDIGEKSSELTGSKRYELSREILANSSSTAASVRYFLNILSRPKWSVVSADESEESERASLIVESAIDAMPVSWSSLIESIGLYKFHGFSVLEWASKKTESGDILFSAVDVRAQYTVERWDIDDDGNILGVWQRSPQTGHELYIPRWKMIHIADTSIVDSPEGLGWFRHIVEPYTRLKELLRIEKIGYSRDLSGTPIGRAPISAINDQVRAGAMSQSDADSYIRGIENFVKMEAKAENTGMILDSKPYQDSSSDGSKTTGKDMWGIDLIESRTNNLVAIGEAVNRINKEIARIIGTENIMVEGGSLALSKDKSANLYLHVDSALATIKETLERDFIGTLCDLNGIDRKYAPTFSVEGAAFKDAELVTSALSNLASAGAVMGPDDPAIREVRNMMGISSPESM